MTTQKLVEIEWTKAKILGLKDKYLKRPSTIKEIRDLERQIIERGGEPDQLDWIS